MLLKKLSLENFGIYGGEFSIDLIPRSSDHFNRPIVLFVGKNGVGKTTFVEAIRLCLHGSLALSSRTGQVEFEQYLVERIHRSTKLAEPQSEASIEVEFDYTESDRNVEYRVKRQWGVVKKKIFHEVRVFENEKELDFLPEQKENFLRELVPPAAADLFFFDGEKLQTFIKEITNNVVLANTIKSFLGLNLVAQLQKDLDIFIARQLSEHGASSLELDLQNITEQLQQKETSQQELLELHRLNQSELAQSRAAIADQEQKIASEGGWYAKRFEELLADRQQIAIQIELIRHQIQEMCNGLMPFAIVPEFLRAVDQRLEKEQEYQKWNAAGQLITEQLNTFKANFESEEFWNGLSIPEGIRSQLLERVNTTIRTTIPKFEQPDQSLILEISERERNTLSLWIGDALDAIPRRFCEFTRQLSELEDTHQKIESQIRLNPSEEKVRPLTERLNQLIRDFGALEHQEKELKARLERARIEVDALRLSLRQLREKIAEAEKYNHQIGLASQTQNVLDDYVAFLTREKLALLDRQLVERFNRLCRKKSFIDSARIDPEHFTVTLYRKGEPFNSDELSAGEKQLFAIAMIWALHTLSELPIPVIIDTPLARLDLEHRHSMLNYYLPHASHQVIVLATDAEVNPEVLDELSANISHSYLLEYNEATESTLLSEFQPFSLPLDNSQSGGSSL
jgi:DNA sulfur modification protein DndD